ncbi:MAG: polysaccharide biosynthesis C-terminal domain-containing protein [Draconibacterium sp.]|nr:polysaccharide biosynthesis C-terminal domain-containing protein [Draconibacterium sp.]
MCYGIIYTFQAINGEILKTKGKSSWVLKLEIITKTILVINIFITWRWGITAIIWGQMVTVFVSYYIGSHYVWKLIGYSLWEQIKDISIYFAISVAMYIIVVSISYLIENSTLALIIMTVTGTIFYILMAWILKLEEIVEAKKIILK